MGTRFFIFCLIIFLAGCQVNNKYYFDSVNGNDNNSGTINLPFKSFKKLNQIDLKNESEIYLANGSVFNGSIELKNKKNIIISSYKNNSSEKKPIINAKGNLSGILVENSSNINISNIQIEANGGNESHNPHQLLKQDLRAGILYIVSDDETHDNFIINDVTIKDIFFNNEGFKRNPKEVRSPNGTQSYGWGIRILNLSDSGNLENITIKNSLIENISHSGIRVKGKLDNKFKNVKVFNNKLLKTGGPGMVFNSTYNLHAYENDINFSGSNDDSRKWGRGSGLWTWGSTLGLIEKNKFQNANGPADSAGCHIDFNCKDIVVQYNLSKNNAGGFVEILGNNYNCSYRYNVSINDGYRVKGEGNNFQEGKSFWLSGFVGNGNKRHGPYNSYIYNNTVFVNKDIVSKIAVNKNSKGVLVANNIFYFEGETAMVLGDQYKPDKGGPGNIENVFFENNLFLKNHWPKEVLIQPNKSIIGNPLFKNLGGESISDYYPTNNDLIKDKGIIVKNIENDTVGIRIGLKLNKDILGNKITNKPDIGAIEIN
ncbi:MAG: right-handed parallel beta-helix repeat-containing protein [Flavobacteriaceae bacterium]|nr:right-handed parallel beta-helix repeat-containing protein [Flavobacteriaceae bacterium]